ncbi:MAG: hypothetical protein O3A10_01285 [Chloroflexi bacterium]|nr:hypothetical protein [Chloroflexota bacterium]
MSRTSAESESRPTGAARKAANCIHHWIIDAPNGRESTGVCKHCGVEKGFSNSTESVMWEQTNTLRNDVREANGASSRFSKPAEIRLSDE